MRTWLLLALFAAPAAAAPKKDLMASMGDSITAALFADTSLEAADAGGDPTTSVSAGFAGSGSFEHKYTLSWSSGKAINSHYVRLRGYLKVREGVDLDVLNTAVTGNKAEDLVRQAREVYRAARGGKYRALRYVTVLVGANDVCFGGAEGTPDGVMRDSVKAALGILASIPQDQPIRVLASSMPDVASVGDAPIREGPFYRAVTCGALWAKLSICQPMVAWERPEEYEARRALIARKNAVLRRAFEEAAAEHPNLSVVFSERFFREPARREQLAADCFHPNRASQRRLADELWKEQPWFPPRGDAALAQTRAALTRSRRRVESRLKSAAY